MTAPLARDQQGGAFELPPEAAQWRVRRHTGGRPSTVLGPDGEPLYVPITADRPDLRSSGCAGSIRLEAVDSEQRPVSAAVAFVELGTGDDTVERSPGLGGDRDMVRTCFDAMTRTMEAMQRAQLERERALAQKEKAIADSQAASQRMNVDLMIALIERVGGGKPQDPLSVLKQQLEFQKALEKQSGANRNAAPSPPLKAEEKSASEPSSAGPAGMRSDTRSARTWPCVVRLRGPFRSWPGTPVSASRSATCT